VILDCISMQSCKYANCGIVELCNLSKTSVANSVSALAQKYAALKFMVKLIFMLLFVYCR
jgi:hypothetical protein